MTNDYVAIATWPFGRIAVEAAARLLEQGSSALDAAIAGAKAVEDDPTVTSVGLGGLPNAIGTVQLDACVMDGQSLACGAVAALENIRHPSAVARRVLEKTPHILLVGEGARLFAVQQGFPLANLHAPHSSLIPHPSSLIPSDSHDTVTILTLDQQGSLAGVCTHVRAGTQASRSCR